MEPCRDAGDGYGGHIKSAWGTAMATAGLAAFTPHTLRHTWATWWYALTPDPVPVVSEITPAQDGSVTLRAGLPSGSGPAFYRAVDLNTLEGR